MVRGMGGVGYSGEWVARWREDVLAAVGDVLAGFEERHGYAPGVNGVPLARGDDLAAAREYGREGYGFADLLTFYESVAEVALPDVGGGFFIHSAREVLDRLGREGPVFVPDAHDFMGMVIASSGAGVLYVADWGGAVHRCRTASPDDGEFDQIDDSFPEFLDRVRRWVVGVAATGTGAAGGLSDGGRT